MRITISRAESYLIDTNVLLRLGDSSSSQHQLCDTAVRFLQSRGAKLCYTLQNATEFWNVSTRPVERNGMGQTNAAVEIALRLIEQKMVFLPDTARVYFEWRTLVALHSIRGIQVHDARLAASMIAHQVPNILTLNTPDFARFSAIDPIHPASLVS